MAKLNIPEYDRTLLEVNKKLEQKKALEKPRHYLGMSQIGHECWRKLFYGFRNASVKIWEAPGIKATEDGFLQEDVMALRLRMLSYIELVTNASNTVDNILGKDLTGRSEDDKKDQIGFMLLLDHFRGHVDGMIRGILEAPQTWHVWENKACNETKFNKLAKLRKDKGEKNALQEWDIEYFMQAQLYMHCANVERHYLTVCLPGGRDYISVRTEYNRKIAENAIAKARAIIFDNWQLPARMSEKREYFQCKWCEHQGICHDKDFPLVHCKTCRYREPVKNGENMCLLKEEIIPENMLHMGCENHIYNPALIQAELIEHQQDCCLYHIPERNIYFANCIINGIPNLDSGKDIHIYTSIELRENIKSVDNITSEVVTLQKEFNGKVYNPKQEKEWNKIDPRLKNL